jgi:solute:Na+ symporter, SSS family
MDGIIVLIYLILLFSSGLYFRAKANTMETYSHVGKHIRTNRLILAATIFAGSVGGGTTFGLTEKILLGNLAYSYALIITVTVDIIVAIYLVPRITQYYGAISIGDIFSKNYGRLGRIMAGLGVVVSSTGFLAAQIKVSSYLLKGIFGFEQNVALIVSYFVIIAYTAIGGLRSIIINNFLQFCAMILGVLMFSFFSLQNISFYDVLSSMPNEKYDLANPSLLYDTICLSLTFSVVICYPTFIQRAVLNRDGKFVKDAVIAKAIIYVFFIAAISFNALIIEYLFPNFDTSSALLESIKKVVPAGISGLVIIGFLSAAMSTADSDLNIASLSVSRDILMPIFGIRKSQKLVRISQVTTILMGIFAIYVSLKFDNIVDIVLSVATLWAPWLLVPFVASLYGIKVKKISLALSSFCGIIACLVWDYHINIKLQGIFVGTMVNLICFIISYYYGRRGRGR